MAKKTRGTCQACGIIMAMVKGKDLGNHGYQRPGCGYIVGNCAGVGHLPYELSCELTKSWLIQVQKKLILMTSERQDLIDDKVEEIQAHTSISVGYGWQRQEGFVGKSHSDLYEEGWKTVTKRGWGTIGWTKDFFFTVKRDHVPSKDRGEAEASKWDKKYTGHDFNHYRNQRIKQLGQWIEAAKADIIVLEKRVKNWVYAPEKLVPGKGVKAAVEAAAE